LVFATAVVTFVTEHYGRAGDSVRDPNGKRSAPAFGLLL
jgi:hypothetical protein